VNPTIPRAFRLVSLFLLSFLLASAAGAADSTDSSASALIVTYHVAPGNRPALRQELEKNGMRQFQRWKSEGILKSYRLLFNRYADSDNWDAMALLTFSSYVEAERWKKLEQTTPAGLSPKALGLITAIHTAPVDLVRSKGTADVATDSVFVVIPYVTMVSAGDYLKYADGYVIPQFDGWIAEGALSQYDLFVGRFPAGRPWSTMVILEYKNEAALAKRNAVEDKVRARLREIPEWKTFSDNKKGIRDEKQVVIADQLSLR
jgi:hypothetical protein